MTSLIVFTDLDGTLLDAQTYSSEIAHPALRRLQATSIPVIFCSAKTYAEQIPIRQQLNITDPYIVENGSAIIGASDHILLADGDDLADGTRRIVIGLEAANIQQLLDEVRAETRLHFEGYADLSTEEVASITGLNHAAAERAKSRDYSETIVTQLSSQESAIFQKACGIRGLKTPNGGKFMTVTGRLADKGHAVQLLAQRYRHLVDDRVVTIGIGDSPNDAPMLASVDQAFLVQRPDGAWRDVHVPNLHCLEAIGAKGFVKMVELVLNHRY